MMAGDLLAFGFGAVLIIGFAVRSYWGKKEKEVLLMRRPEPAARVEKADEEKTALDWAMLLGKVSLQRPVAPYLSFIEIVERIQRAAADRECEGIAVLVESSGRIALHTKMAEQDSTAREKSVAYTMGHFMAETAKIIRNRKERSPRHG